ncbi:MAG: chemotaxis protein CheC [Deltaproteobacteria bacterium]|nr:chemotaxis protein CheC [Deltaproteobacteria bacterium]
MKKLSEGELDFLRELSNIGVGHAATALSQLIGRQVGMRVPKVTIVDLSSVPELMGGSEKIVSGVYLQVLGDARGGILLIFPDESSKALLKLLLKGEEDPLSEMGMSTLKEVGNILASAYLSVLGNMLDITLIPSIPSLAHDMVGAVVDLVLINLGEVGDTAFVFETEFYDIAEDIKGHFFLLPDPDSIDVIMKAIKRKNG